MNGGVDVLMITYNRPQYTRLSLQRLLDTRLRTRGSGSGTTGRMKRHLTLCGRMSDTPVSPIPSES